MVPGRRKFYSTLFFITLLFAVTIWVGAMEVKRFKNKVVEKKIALAVEIAKKEATLKQLQEMKKREAKVQEKIALKDKMKGEIDIAVEAHETIRAIENARGRMRVAEKGGTLTNQEILEFNRIVLSFNRHIKTLDKSIRDMVKVKSIKKYKRNIII